MSCVETLKQAKVLLSTGWCQGENRPDGCYTVLSAIAAVRFDIMAIYTASEMARQLGYRSTAEYNDNVGRTQEQVLEFMDATISLAIEREFYNPSLGEPYPEPIEEEARTEGVPTA